MLLPLVVSLLYGERSVAFVFCTAAVFCTVFGLLLLCLQQQRKAKIQVRKAFCCCIQLDCDLYLARYPIDVRCVSQCDRCAV